MGLTFYLEKHFGSHRAEQIACLAHIPALALGIYTVYD